MQQKKLKLDKKVLNLAGMNTNTYHDAQLVMHKFFEERSISSKKKFEFKGEKASGKAPGRRTIHTENKNEYIEKETSKSTVGNGSRAYYDFLCEYLYAPVYRRYLYNNAPEIELVYEENIENEDKLGTPQSIDKTNKLFLRSKILPKFCTLADYSGERSGHTRIVKPVKDVIGLEKLFMTSYLLGESDPHARNIGVNTETKQVYKIDHGKSGLKKYNNATELLADLIGYWSNTAGCNYISEYNETNVPFNVQKLKSAIRENAEVSIDEVRVLFEAQFHKLVSLGFDVSGTATIVDTRIELLEANSEAMQELLSRLEVIELIQADDEAFQNGDWLAIIGAVDPIIWAARNDEKINGQDPLQWAKQTNRIDELSKEFLPIVKLIKPDDTEFQDGGWIDAIALQDPIEWAAKNQILIEGKDPVLWAIENNAKIRYKDPLKAASELGLPIDGKDPVAWAVFNKKIIRWTESIPFMTVHHCDPVQWALVHNKKIEGKYPIAWAIQNNQKIEGINAAEWAARNDKPVCEGALPAIIAMAKNKELIENEDPILWALTHSVKINNKNALVAAVELELQVKGMDPIVWAVDNKKLIENEDPIVWAVNNNKLIDGKNPIVWAVDNNKLIKLKNPIIWASKKRKTIDGAHPVIWAARNKKLIWGQDPIVWARANGVSEYGGSFLTIAATENIAIAGEDPIAWIANLDERIDHENPIVWAVANKRLIAGKDPFVWALDNKKSIHREHPTIWALYNRKLIEGENPIEWAVLKNRKIKDIDPIIWAWRNNKVIFGADPIDWAVLNNRQIDGEDPIAEAAEYQAEIQGKDAIKWAVLKEKKIENYDPIIWAVLKGKKIEGEDPLYWAAAGGYAIDGENPIKWHVLNDKYINGQDPILWGRYSKKIDGMSTIAWAVQKNQKIAGIDAKVWIRQEKLDEMKNDKKRIASHALACILPLGLGATSLALHYTSSSSICLVFGAAGVSISAIIAIGAIALRYYELKEYEARVCSI